MTDTSRVLTVLERAVARGQRGLLPAESVLWVLAASNVVMLSDDEVGTDEFPSQPLVVRRGEASFLALFTHEEFTQPYRVDRSAIAAPAFEILRRRPPSVGLVINPGNSLGLEVPSLGIHAFTRTLLERTPE